MDRPFFAALIGAAGGLVVWLLNWSWLLYSEHRIRTRIRTMLSIELEENLTMLRAFESAAQNHTNFKASPILAKMQRRDQLTIAPLPTWKHAIWEGMAASVPRALHEQKIREVYQFHLDLDELNETEDVFYRLVFRP